MGPGSRWRLASPPPEEVRRALASYPPLVAHLLHNRGIASQEEAERFLAADERLRADPFLLPDMERAVGRLLQALYRGERVAVYGDFDADGISATALLVEALQALGADPIPYIPHRVNEGHGLNSAALRILRDRGCTLVVSADCGITGLQDGGEVPKSLDIIVTDHHLPTGDWSHALAAVNPHLPGSRPYPWPQLAGVGLALKLAQALFSALGRPWDESLLEFAALGTVADVAPLIGENRYIVRRGIQALRRTQRPGLQALASQAGVALSSLDHETIGFILAPRLNAAGRLEHAEPSLRLLLTQDPVEAQALADRLGLLNSRRQELTQKALARAEEELHRQEAEGPLGPLLMVGGADFPAGIVGLVAGRLAEQYYRPAIVYQQDGDYVRGSARSITEFDVTAAIAQCADLLFRFGGHHQAAGFTTPAANLEPLRRRLQEIAREELANLDLRPTLAIDAEAPLSSLPGPTMRFLQDLAPYGLGNRQPSFLARNLFVLDARSLGDGTHARLKMREGNAVWDAVAFRLGDRLAEMQGEIGIVYTFNTDPRSPNGTMEVSLLDFAPSSSSLPLVR
ncbi:MAG: single-stranded-DNA-specific exonuclease RecJ [Chloroflexi bacterium]|nr:single-stranded-DNA-specific exonuclease RecJ [Chloroflexota bacterium]